MGWREYWTARIVIQQFEPWADRDLDKLIHQKLKVNTDMSL